MSQLRSLLVGSHFRPPAKQILATLPSGTPLRLQRELDNPYDEAALRVMFDTTGLQPSLELDGALASCGWTFEDLLAEGEIQLGYVAASDGKPLAQAAKAGVSGLVGNRELAEFTEAILGFDARGEPTVICTSGATTVIG